MSILDWCKLKYGFSNLFGKAGMKWLGSVDVNGLGLMLSNHLRHIECLN